MNKKPSDELENWTPDKMELYKLIMEECNSCFKEIDKMRAVMHGMYKVKYTNPLIKSVVNPQFTVVNIKTLESGEKVAKLAFTLEKNE